MVNTAKTDCDSFWSMQQAGLKLQAKRSESELINNNLRARSTLFTALVVYNVQQEQVKRHARLRVGK